MTQFADLADHDEDKRINIIGSTVMSTRKTAAVVVDDVPGKLERYVKKLKERFPGIVILDEIAGPTPGARTVRCGPPGTVVQTDGTLEKQQNN